MSKFTDATISMLGKTGRDRITKLQGVISSVCFDLYGCVQCVLAPPAKEDGTLPDGRWFDVNRIEVVDNKRVMEIHTAFITDPPQAEVIQPKNWDHGPCEKPAR